MTVLIRLPEVERRTGRSSSSIYEDIREGTFPRQISIGKRAVAWDENSIEKWIHDRIEATEASQEVAQ